MLLDGIFGSYTKARILVMDEQLVEKVAKAIRDLQRPDLDHRHFLQIAYVAIQATGVMEMRKALAQAVGRLELLEEMRNEGYSGSLPMVTACIEASRKALSNHEQSND